MAWRVKYVVVLYQECAMDLPHARKCRGRGSGALLCPSMVCLHAQGCAACRGPAQRSGKGGLGKCPASSRGEPAAACCFRLLPGCRSTHAGSLCHAAGESSLPRSVGDVRDLVRSVVTECVRRGWVFCCCKVFVLVP